MYDDHSRERFVAEPGKASGVPRGDFERELSPHWRGVQASHRGLGALVPHWVVGVGAAGVLLCVYAALLFAAAVGMDTFDVTRMTKAGERLEQSIEEIVELFADQSLLSSVLLMLTHYIRSLRS